MSLAQDGGPVGEQEAPTCSKDSQREVGDGLPRVGLVLGPARPRPQDGQGPRMAVAPQQLLVLVAKDHVADEKNSSRELRWLVHGVTLLLLLVGIPGRAF